MIYNSHIRRWTITAYDYVAFRSPYPDETTEKMLLKELQDNKMDVSQLIQMGAGHCLQA